MILLDHVSELIKQSTQPYEHGRFVVVPTLLTYDSGKVVQAYVEGGSDRFVVSDGGAAVFEFVKIGGFGETPVKNIRVAAAGYGLRANDDGWIHSGTVSGEQLSTYMSIVAECSVSVDAALKRMARKQRGAKDFKQTVNDELRKETARPVVRRKHLFGASNKQHVFDFGVELGDDRTLVVDAVVPDANSVNSAVVAHMDLKQSNNPRVSQLIVFDDSAHWTGSDLNLLRLGAPTIPISAMKDRVTRLALH